MFLNKKTILKKKVIQISENNNLLRLYEAYMQVNQMDEFQILLEQCKVQNRKACITFYNMFYKKIYNCCLRILNNEMEAEEVMQDTLLKIFQNLNNFSGDRKMMQAYLQKIAIHHSLGIIKKQKNNIFTTLDEKNEEMTDTLDTFSEIIDIQVEKIKECMQKLPQGYRIIINLRLIEDMPYHEIASFLSIKESSVRSQYTRGIKKLKLLLN